MLQRMCLFLSGNQKYLGKGPRILRTVKEALIIKYKSNKQNIIFKTWGGSTLWKPWVCNGVSPIEEKQVSFLSGS